MLMIQLPSEWFDLIQQGFDQTQGDPLRIVDGKERDRSFQIRILHHQYNSLVRQSGPGSPDSIDDQENQADDEHMDSPRGTEDYDEPDWDDQTMTQLATMAQKPTSISSPVPIQPMVEQSPRSSQPTNSQTSPPIPSIAVISSEKSPRSSRGRNPQTPPPIPSPTAISPARSVRSPCSQGPKQFKRISRTQTGPKKPKRITKPRLRISTRTVSQRDPSRSQQSVNTQQGGDSNESEGDSQNPSPTSDEEEAIAWIRHTPTQEVQWAQDRPIGVVEASQMYRMACAIGSPEVYQSWQRILRIWRQEGHPIIPLLLGLGDTRPIRIPEHLGRMRQQMITLYHAHQAVENAEVGQELQDMAYRYHLACLFQSYGEAEAKLIQTADARKSGTTNRAYIKQVLFGVMHPQWAHIPNPQNNILTRKAWKRVDNRLQHGSRWFYLQQHLGEGILYILPNARQIHTYIKRTLTLQRFQFWVYIIQRFNPDGVKMGRELMQTILQIQRTSSMPPKALAIERYSLPDLKRLEAIEGPFQTIDEGQQTSGDEQIMESIQNPGINSDLLTLLGPDWEMNPFGDHLV